MRNFMSRASKENRTRLSPSRRNERAGIPGNVICHDGVSGSFLTISHSQKYLAETTEIAATIDHEAIERIVAELEQLRARGGRLFLLGVGGSAANCSHAVNDFRKLADIEAYTPIDNVSELTARTNDEGWDTVFDSWLKTSHACGKDAVFVLSVGGGDEERKVSVNIVRALDEAKRRGLKIYGIVGRREGYTKRVGDEVVVVPAVDPAHLTPHAEAFQAVIWHCIVFHPRLNVHRGKWETITKAARPELSMRRAVFLDRDGVVNKAIIRDGRVYAPTSMKEVEVLPGAVDAVQKLRQAGFCVIVVTNQPDVATGTVTREVVEEMHRHLCSFLAIDGIKACYHRDEDGCGCRKPKPGLLLEAAKQWSLDLKRSIMIGDRWRDIGAGKAAGCYTILIGDGYGELKNEMPDAQARSLCEASGLILGDHKRAIEVDHGETDRI